MSDVRKALNHELETSLALGLLKSLRDEARLKVHLAGMDAKDEWKKLEAHLLEVESAAARVSDTSHAALTAGVRQNRMSPTLI